MPVDTNLIKMTAREAVDADENQFDRDELLAELETQMLTAAEALEFEKAADMRDKIRQLKDAPEIRSAPTGADGPKPGTPRRKGRRKGKKFRSRKH